MFKDAEEKIDQPETAKCEKEGGGGGRWCSEKEKNANPTINENPI